MLGKLGINACLRFFASLKVCWSRKKLDVEILMGNDFYFRALWSEEILRSPLNRNFSFKL